MELYQWICVLAIPNIVGVVWAYLFNKRMKKKEAEQLEIKRQNDLQEKELKATKLGVQALLRDRLVQAFKYHIAKGFVDYDDRNNVCNMYTQYEALGVNGVMSVLYEQFMALPLIAKGA